MRPSFWIATKRANHPLRNLLSSSSPKLIEEIQKSVRKAECLHARDLVRGIVTVLPLNAHSVIRAYAISTVDVVRADAGPPCGLPHPKYCYSV
jgi:hypothetical protein